MSSPAGTERTLRHPPEHLVERAIRVSYAQVMLAAIFGASTGGMFLVGFAMRLGADDLLLGLIQTVPAFFVIFQLAAAYCVERGASRKKLAIVFGMIMACCWVLIASIPVLGGALGPSQRIALLIAVITVVTIAGQVAGNARSSWVGELIPESRRGRFFGYTATFAGIIAAIFAVAEGRFLDVVKQSHDLFSFTALFLFGAGFGLATAALHIPQPDCPLPHSEESAGFLKHLRQTIGNRPLVLLALVHATIAMGGIAGPFGPAYCLRDVGIGYFGLGLLNSASTVTALLSSPLWGRLSDRFGCRPVLVLGLVVLMPLSAVWVFIPPGMPHRAYMLLPWSNALAGAASAAVGISLTTMIYKLTRPAGRSIQLAAYSIFVTFLSAPMPLLGGWLVTHLRDAGWAIDLRLTFYLWSLFMALAAAMAWRLREPGSLLTRSLVLGYFPGQLDGLFRAVGSSVAGVAALFFRRGGGK